MDTIFKLKEHGSTLGLRELAKQINESLKEYINKNKNIILDFE